MQISAPARHIVASLLTPKTRKICLHITLRAGLDATQQWCAAPISPIAGDRASCSRAEGLLARYICIQSCEHACIMESLPGGPPRELGGGVRSGPRRLPPPLPVADNPRGEVPYPEGSQDSRVCQPCLAESPWGGLPEPCAAHPSPLLAPPPRSPIALVQGHHRMSSECGIRSAADTGGAFTGG